MPEISSDQKTHIKSLYEGVVRSLNNPDSNFCPTSRSRRSSSQLLRPQVTGVTSVISLSSDKISLLHLKRKVGSTWEYSDNLTGVYLDILHEITTSGTIFRDKNALLTGVGKGSIGVEVVKGFSSGGGVIAVRLLNTTNQFSSLPAVAARLSPSPLSSNHDSELDFVSMMDFYFKLPCREQQWKNSESLSYGLRPHGKAYIWWKCL